MKFAYEQNTTCEMSIEIFKGACQHDFKTLSKILGDTKSNRYLNNWSMDGHMLCFLVLGLCHLNTTLNTFSNVFRSMKLPSSSCR